MVEDRIDTGLIRCKDSLRYGTSLERVIPKFVFNGGYPAAAYLYMDTTVITLTGNDTINFEAANILLRIYSQDQTAQKWYRIQLYVHQVDPNQFTWHEVDASSCPAAPTLPTLDSLKSLFTDSILPADFPIEAYGLVGYENYLLVAGGYDALGNMTAARYLFEFNKGNVRIANLAKEDKSSTPFAGVALAYYNKQIYAFGGVDEDMNFLSPKVSDDLGLHWSELDLSNYQLTATSVDTITEIFSRWKMEVYTDSIYLYLKGGQDKGTKYTDAYRALLNSVSFKNQ